MILRLAFANLIINQVGGLRGGPPHYPIRLIDPGPGATPASRPRACQCLGWRRRRPARTSAAYDSQTPNVDDKAEIVTDDRLNLVCVCFLVKPGRFRV